MSQHALSTPPSRSQRSFRLPRRWRATRSDHVHLFWRYVCLCLLVMGLFASTLNAFQPVAHAAIATSHSAHVATDSGGVTSPTSALTRWSHPEWGTAALNEYAETLTTRNLHNDFPDGDYSNEYLPAQQAPGTVPVYSCNYPTSNGYNPSTLSLYSDCHDTYGRESSITFYGYIYSPSSPQPSTVPTKPLYACTSQVLGGPASGTIVLLLEDSCDGNGIKNFLGYGLTVSSISDHWVTTGNATSAGLYTLQGTLGYLSTTQQAGMVPLYGCTVPSSGNHFVSFDVKCEGIGVGDSSVSSLPFTLGYVYAGKPANTIATPIYRCHSGPDFSVSTDSTCGGLTVDGPLGFLSPTSDTASALVTTGNGGSVAAFSYLLTLGYILQNQLAGTIPLYGCTVGGKNIHFTSFDVRCEGIGVGDSSVTSLPFLLGYVYASPPPGVAVTQIYRCHLPTGSGSVFFDSTDTNCEGQPKDGTQGYVLPNNTTVYSCNDGRVFTQQNVDATVQAAQQQPNFSASGVQYLQSNPCAATELQSITDTTFVPDATTAVASTNTVKGVSYASSAPATCRDYYWAVYYKYPQVLIDAGIVYESILATLQIDKHVCFDGTSVTNPTEKAEIVPWVSGNGSFWGWTANGISGQYDQAYQVGSNPNGGSASFAQGHFTFVPKAAFIPLSIPGLNINAGGTWDPTIKLIVFGNGCYLAAPGGGTSQICPPGYPYHP